METCVRQRSTLALFVAALGIASIPGNAANADCLTPANAIEAENCLPGNPPSEWDVIGRGRLQHPGLRHGHQRQPGADHPVQGQDRPRAATASTSTASATTAETGRARWPRSRRRPRSPSLSQPACTNSTGLVDCGNWAVSASWTVPATATSGIYIARLVRTDTGGASHIVFIVRQDGGTSNILFQTSDTTWHAYNRYGGNSLYEGTGPGTGLSGVGRAYKVSYNRPFNTRETAPRTGSSTPSTRWSGGWRANGYDVSYIDRSRHRSPRQRAPQPQALPVRRPRRVLVRRRSARTSRRLATTRRPCTSPSSAATRSSGRRAGSRASTAPSPPTARSSATRRRTSPPAKIDPSAAWTGTWRDPRFSPPSDGGRPENALSGTIFTVNGVRNDSFEVPAADGKMRFWRNTPNVSFLTAGQVWSAPTGTLGYEWDEDLDNGFRPAGLVRLSSTTINVTTGVVQDYGSTYAPGLATHHLVFHKRSNGALVFGAGTVQWPWGLDDEHDRGSDAPSVDMQQATVNLFADMGVQPATLQAGLLPASASADVVAPVSDITFPADNASVPGRGPGHDPGNGERRSTPGRLEASKCRSTQG